MKQRLFLAIPLPDVLSEEIAGLVRGCAESIGAEGFRCIEPKRLHITMHFFGDIHEQRIPYIRDALLGVLANWMDRSYELTFRRAGAFPSLRQPRVYWIAPDDPPDALFQHQSAISDALFEQGFPRERRRFMPHLTVAYQRQVKDRQTLMETAEAMRGCLEDHMSALHFRVTRVVLYESLTHDGMVHHLAINEWPLRSATPGANRNADGSPSDTPIQQERK